MAFKMKYNSGGFPFKEKPTKTIKVPDVNIEKPEFKPFSGYLEKDPKEKYLDFGISLTEKNKKRLNLKSGYDIETGKFSGLNIGSQWKPKDDIILGANIGVGKNPKITLGIKKYIGSKKDKNIRGKGII
tara:strand:- start:46 stop:432 length:387 start_codon:yes stop_codon:yes gene_type:complete